jgi:hypothetical protein
MKGAIASAATLYLLAMAQPAAAAEIGCFSDGGAVFLHVGDIYQFYLDQGEPQVDCTPEAAKLGLELTEDAAQRLCAEQASLCEEKKKQAQLIRDTYADLLRQAGYVEPPPAQAAAETAAETPAKPTLRLNSRDTIRFVQTSLLNLGYDPGGADGAMGKRTAAAIKKYEKDNGLRVTGKVTKTLIVSLQKKAKPE